MGLDQYAQLRNKEGKVDVQEDFYWRKHARLQQFMSAMYAKQNPKGTRYRIFAMVQR